MLVDRSLSWKVAQALNYFPEIHAIALRDLYPNDPDAHSVPDTVWIEDAGRAGWCAVTQNWRIHLEPDEAKAIVTYGTKVFSLADASWPPHRQCLVLGRNLMRVQRNLATTGGCFMRISERKPIRDIPKRPSTKSSGAPTTPQVVTRPKGGPARSRLLAPESGDWEGA